MSVVVVVDLDSFWPDANQQRRTECGSMKTLVLRKDSSKGSLEFRAISVQRVHAGVNQVDFTKKTTDKGTGWACIKMKRYVNLADTTTLKDRDSIRYRECLFLVVGDVHRGRADLLANTTDFRPEIVAEFGVEVGKRLIKEQHLGLNHQSPGKRHSLLLSA